MSEKILLSQCAYCHKMKPSFKTDGFGNVVCEKCAMHSGQMPIVRRSAKKGRNSQCICGSGKKNKFCCNQK